MTLTNLPRMVHALTFWTATAALSAFTLTHLLADDATVLTAAAHSLSGYAWLTAVPLALWAAVYGTRRRSAATLPLAALAVLWTAPGHRSAVESTTPAVRVASANLLMIHRDPATLIAELVAHNPDVMLLQEVSHHWAAAMEDSTALLEWPHRLVVPQDGSFGVAVLSKTPFSAEVVDLLGVPMAQVDITVDGETLRLFDVHTLPPRTDLYAAVWHAQMQALAMHAAQSPYPTVFAGDFNATRHHPSYQRLLEAGLRDAHSEVGRASAATWPNGLFPVPPMRLDHILLGEGVGVVAISEGDSHGSDHSPLFADIGWSDVGPRRTAGLRMTASATY